MPPLKKPVTENFIHICVDAQKMFQSATDWHIPWFERALPQMVALTAANPARTIFTRFIPALNKGEGRGTWREYYHQWENMTLDVLGHAPVEIVDDLAQFIPPARIINKKVYSPWLENDLHSLLQKDSIDTLIISGGETDVCVLATIMGAVDYGYRVIVAHDATCGSCDDTHDKILALYDRRFNAQVEPASTEEIIYLLGKG